MRLFRVNALDVPTARSRVPISDHATPYRHVPKRCIADPLQGQSGVGALGQMHVLDGYVKATKSGTIVIHGKGAQTRDFVYLDDVVEAMVSAATAPTVNRLVINIGCGQETSIHRLSQLVLDTVNGDTERIYKEDQDQGAPRMCADIKLARKKLGFKPRYPLQEGLLRMIAQDPRF